MSKKIIVGVLAVSALGISVLGATAVSALGGFSKAEKLAELTSKSESEIIYEKHNSDKTYGEIANENGVLEQFVAYAHEHQRAIVQEKVNNGVITEEKAAEILDIVEERQSNCDGTGNHRDNHSYHAYSQGEGRHGENRKHIHNQDCECNHSCNCSYRK